MFFFKRLMFFFKLKEDIKSKSCGLKHLVRLGHKLVDYLITEDVLRVNLRPGNLYSGNPTTGLGIHLEPVDWVFPSSVN